MHVLVFQLSRRKPMMLKYPPRVVSLQRKYRRLVTPLWSSIGSYGSKSVEHPKPFARGPALEAQKCRTPEGSASDEEFVDAIERLFIAICKRSGIGSTTNDVTVARLADFEEAMNAKFARFESELRGEVKTLKTEMEGLRSEFAGIKALLNEVNLKIASAAGENKNA
ncbi:lysine--tRNA ligase [Striga asiatica]|uniref:Lysine--tRNA ligase n=1 Tax=Striga asiatica TaxID=4170 RepID=A0A5A7RIB1_STRAF|nr:lysine--tRNA ligase [Striga asiatica]